MTRGAKIIALSRIPKFEIRDPKEIRTPKPETLRIGSLPPHTFSNNSPRLASGFGVRISCGFRSFGFRTLSSLLWAGMSFALVCCVVSCATDNVAAVKNETIKPGLPWLDTDGVHINAHGFCIVPHEGKFYWYGAHKIAGKTEDEKNEAGVRCYVSTDLVTWKNAGLVLDVFAPGADPELRDAFILDRPKVIFHAATKRFILYFKLYPPKEQGGKTGKDFAFVGVATSPTPTGPFEYQGRFFGAGSETGSGDFAIYQEADGAVYHIAVRKPDKGRKDKPLVCGRLTDDGLKPAGDYVVMEGVINATEGPALFRRAGKYYLLGSDSTGWKPNPARLFVADQLTGPYQFLGNPCRGINPHNQLGPEKTFGGQSTFVFPLPGKPNEWIAMFDINNASDPINAGYIWLPLKFEDGKPVIKWQTEWSLAVFSER